MSPSPDTFFEVSADPCLRLALDDDSIRGADVAAQSGIDVQLDRGLPSQALQAPPNP